MHISEIQKNKKIMDYFKALKILAVFFCSTPLFQIIFTTNGETIIFRNIYLIISFIIMTGVILFIWFIINHNFTKYVWAKNIEIFVLYALCLTSIVLNNGYTSYYKFLFIFVILIYTMDRGKTVGMILASVASLTILFIDLLAYNKPDQALYFQSDIILACMFFVVVWVISFYLSIEEEHINDLKDYANKDGLTDIANHRFLQVTLDNMFAEDKEAEKPLSFVMLDIDNFKVYNDIFGHQQGDEILQKIAGILKENMGQDNFISRYGGEEFAIVLANTTEEKAVEFSDKIRGLVENTYFHGQEMLPNHNLTVSVGISCRKGKTDTKKEMIERADNALYRAKFFKKNRVEVYSSIFDNLSDMSDIDRDVMLSIKSLITIINSRDRYTSRHTDRVVHYCSIYADSAKLSKEDKNKLIYSAYLHDVGKINVSKETLLSDKKLTPIQWEEIKKHPSDGAEIICQMKGLDEVAKIVSQHHEKIDGSGYPCGIKGDEIHPLAKILTVVDSFDAMTAKRPYQKVKKHDAAFEELRRCSGTQFDAEVAEKFISAICSCYK